MSSVLTKFQENLLAGKEIISIYCDNSLEAIRYVMLLAQMQSGKTFVYTFVMCEMFRQRKVEKAIIFSGNAEVALREQTRRCMEDEEYQIFYKEYLFSLGVQEEMVEDCWEGLKARITRNFEVIWGIALKKKMEPKNKTLFIWDESHFAQDQGMCPDKFFEQMGIILNGDWMPLRERDNYVLSVSATSFSEASNAIHQDQSKAVVTFSPSPAYMSIKKMKENGMIVPFDNPKVCVLEQMRSSVSRVGKRKYGIIRIGHNVGSGNEDEKFYKMIATKAKWNIKLYYETLEPEGIDTLECLNDEPVGNTLILVKDRCRMGQQLPKQNISFVIETAGISRTDVLLQGLLGRMCGYHNYTGIRICLRRSFVESEELDKYLQFVKKSNTGFPTAIPINGNNMVKGRNMKEEEEDEMLWKVNIPKTTGKEVFCRMTEMGNVVPSNGQCSEDLVPETANDVDLMKNAVINRVERSLQDIKGLIISRNITSNKSVGSSWSGIYVSKEVFEALAKGGVIYEEVKEKHGLKLKCEKQRGKKVSGERMIRLIQISW